MNRLIDRLMSGEGKLGLLLLDAKEYAANSDDEAFIKFIDNEINGYEGNEIPEYRKINAEIVGDIQNSFGQLLYKQYPLDFSKISNQLGFDLSQIVFPDSISFVESTVEELSGIIALRPIPTKLVGNLNEILEFNNPGMRLIAAYHQFGKTSITFILDKVRQELILGLRRLQKAQKPVESTKMPTTGIERPTSVFVTYAWGGEEFNDMIISFVDFLRQKGYNASMDRKESQDETSINFNRLMIEGIQNSEKVIVILTDLYKKKADAFEGGVGMEYQLILEDIKKNLNKYIFVSFGNLEFDEIVPTGIKGREILNLKNDQSANFNSLFSKLNSQNIIEFSDINETVSEVKKKEIKPFKL